MISVKSDGLTVEILDPVCDRDRLGPRFCTGGYIYQVNDKEAGPLCSGPEYPSANPSTINGQGFPDVFQFTLFESEQEELRRKLIIGVGFVAKSKRMKATESHFDARVEEFCSWDVMNTGTGVEMQTKQADRGWSLVLRREVLLKGRTILSRTTLFNTGAKPLPWRWFSHPFFPVPSSAVCAHMPAGSRLEQNPAFTLDTAGSLRLTRGYDWAQGHFQPVQDFPSVNPFRILQSHPRTTGVELECRFVPARIALWGNDRTVSVEPFTLGSISGGQSTSWEIAYTFGKART